MPSRRIVTLAAAGILLAICAAAQDAVVGGVILVEATYQHLGVLWRISSTIPS